MAVAHDASTEDGSFDSTDTISFAHTCTGSNRCLIFGAGFFSGSMTITTMTYNSVGMTAGGAIETDGGGGGTVIYYLKAPATGSNTVLCVFNSSAGGGGSGASSYTGVDQTTPVSGFNSANGANSSAPTVDITSATGDMVVDSMEYYDAGGDWTIAADGGQTQIYDVEDGGQQTNAAGSYEAGAGTVTMSWTISEETDWAIVALNLEAAAAGGTGIQLNIGDAWKVVDGMQINIGDAWKTVDGAQVNIGDAWKTIF